MDKDIFGEIINGEKTFKNIAMLISNGQPVIIGWTDEENTHYDILFTLGVYQYGIIQGGIQDDYLYISIMRKGAFAFRMDQEHSKDYIAEKLDIFGLTTQKKLTELINQIIKKCNEYEELIIL